MIDVLSKLYEQDLDEVQTLLKAFPEEKVWHELIANANSAGVIIQHICGNLTHFIGRGMGQIDYKRDRKHEFVNTEKKKLILQKELAGTAQIVVKTLAAFPVDELDFSYPLEFPYDYTNREMLVHLYGHLNYHRGQLSYLLTAAQK